jgi:hypothetical protein
MSYDALELAVPQLFPESGGVSGEFVAAGLPRQMAALSRLYVQLRHYSMQNQANMLETPEAQEDACPGNLGEEAPPPVWAEAHTEAGGTRSGKNYLPIVGAEPGRV